MVKSKNERLTITLTKAQVKWLKTTAKRLDITVSKLIKWLIDKNIAKFASYMPREQLEMLIEIAKTPWVVDFED